MHTSTPSGPSLPYGLRLLQGAVQNGFVAALSDRDWRTLTAILSLTQEPGRLQLTYDQLSAVLPDEPDAWQQRLVDLAEARLRGEAVIFLTDDGAGDGVALWYNHWLFGSEDGAGPHDLSPLYRYAENLMGRALANAEILAIRKWHSEFGLEREVIAELLEECVEQREIKRLNYLEAVARGWFDDGIRTLADLQRRRKQDREALARYTRIINYVQLGRAPTEPEKRMMQRWSHEWGFSDEVIMRACEATIGAKYPLRQADRILEHWRQHGVRSVADAEALLAKGPPSRRRAEGGGAAVEQRGQTAGQPAAARPAPAGLRRKQSYDDLIIR